MKQKLISGRDVVATCTMNVSFLFTKLLTCRGVIIPLDPIRDAWENCAQLNFVFVRFSTYFVNELCAFDVPAICEWNRKQCPCENNRSAPGEFSRSTHTHTFPVSQLKCIESRIKCCHEIECENDYRGKETIFREWSRSCLGWFLRLHVTIV